MALSQDASDAATWVRHVTRIPRNKVDVNMHSCLTRCLPDIDTYVIAVWRMLTLHGDLGLAKKVKHGRLFLGGHIEKACDVAFWNYKNVSSAERVAVMASVGQLILNEHIPSYAQLACRLVSGHSC
jgi:hypothetical protein